MTLFELLFGLTAVILGLALTHIAASLRRLMHAGRSVRWAPEPVLLTAIILLVVISVWIEQWQIRDISSITTAQATLQVLMMLAIYFAAAGVLPETPDGEERIDLFRHYDRTRWLNYGALIAGLILFLTYYLVEFGGRLQTFGAIVHWAILPAIYLSLIFIRWRPYNVLALVYVLSTFAYSIWFVRLTG